MNTVSVMQPYFFPYFGVFELIKKSNIHVILDNVGFRKKGFINRNYLIYDGARYDFNLRINKISQNKKIKDHTIFDNSENFLKLFSMLDLEKTYKSDITEILKDAKDKSVSDVLSKLLERTMKELDIKTSILYASNMNLDDQNVAQDRILDICENLKATSYINLPGGRKLYNQFDFRKKSINLDFLQPDLNTFSENHKIKYQSILGLMHKYDSQYVRDALTFR
jgi:predicted CopG family antitoxin